MRLQTVARYVPETSERDARQDKVFCKPIGTVDPSFLPEGPG